MRAGLLALTGGTGLTASVIAVVSWADASRLALSATPTATFGEAAELVRLDGRYLLPPILATVVLCWGIGVLRGTGRRDHSAAGPPGGLREGSGRTAAGYSTLALPVVGAWAAFVAVLASSGYSIKVGWLAGAVLLGLLTGRLVFELSARAARGVRRGDGPGASALWPLAMAIALWTPACLAPGSRGEAPITGGSSSALGPPSFIFIVIDALRADRLGVYGHTRNTSPEMDRLAREGILFRDAVAPSSWTLPSMASILTSTTVGQHGLVRRGDVLPREADDLPGRLYRAGYRTAAFTTNPWLKRGFGFDDGFQVYHDLDRLGLARRLLGVRLKNLLLHRARRIRVDPELVPGAEEVTSRALGWLRDNRDHPFFLYLHYMDVHSPYDPPRPFHDVFCPGHRFEEPDFRLEADFRRGEHAGDREVLDHVLELYDAGILATDASIGRLERGVHELGLDASTLLVITSDHGEEFYDHGGVMHGTSLYEELVRVPLIVRPPASPGFQPAEVNERVSTLDLYPTILDLAGLQVPARVMGVSLGPWLGGNGVASPRLVGSQLHHEGHAWTALYTDADKFIRRKRVAEEGSPAAVRPSREGSVPITAAGALEQGGDAAPDTRTPAEADPASRSHPAVLELYHLDRDPHEKINTAGLEPTTVAGFERIMATCDSAWGVPGVGGGRPSTDIIDADTLQQLRALGYVD